MADGWEVLDLKQWVSHSETVMVRNWNDGLAADKARDEARAKATIRDQARALAKTKAQAKAQAKPKPKPKRKPKAKAQSKDKAMTPVVADSDSEVWGSQSPGSSSVSSS